MKNIAVLVSGGGTNLQAIIDAIKNGIITNGIIRIVISSKEGVYALERAKLNNIDSIVILKDNLSIEEYTKELIKYMKLYRIDLIVLAGFLNIIGIELIKEYKNRIINIHPSLLPSFCGKGMYGLKVHETALERGVKVTGATTHFVTEVIDGGPIILQKEVHLKSNDTPESLQKRVMEKAEWIILPKSIDLFCNDKLKVIGNHVFYK